jgi:hypothetical protein
MKLYKIVFMNYTNYMDDTVSDGNNDIGKIKYISIGNEPFIVTEYQLDKIKKYGNGIRSCTFIGNLWDENK